MLRAIYSNMPDGVSNNKLLELLDFTLGCEEYGIDIINAQEIRLYKNVIRIANAAEYLKVDCKIFLELLLQSWMFEQYKKLESQHTINSPSLLS